jgi:hypothetical protein
MTPEQALGLTSGDRVMYEGNPADGGTVKHNNGEVVVIRWDEFNEDSLARVDDMASVERLPVAVQA